jgi:hypothetical protein
MKFSVLYNEKGIGAKACRIFICARAFQGIVEVHTLQPVHNYLKIEHTQE